METPLTPIEFARRSRKLYAQREAVVDGELRLTYAQFFERCDRASAALSKLGIGKGDRVATIAPNTVAHLEQFYAVPQLGAVEATATAMRGGWFHSGDAAVVHADGYVEIRDRLKDLIISGGENISSVEVEGVLLRHPAVLEVAVVGLPHEKWGETPHAFVVLRPGFVTGEKEIHEFCRANLARFKTPKAYSFVTELPKTATGKIQKYLLRGKPVAETTGTASAV